VTIAGFAELIEVNSVSFPRRTIPVLTRYWYRKHECLSLSLRGKFGQAIDLMETGTPGMTSASDEDRGQSANLAGAISTLEARCKEGSIGRDEITDGDKHAIQENKAGQVFPGRRTVVVADAGIVDHGKTHDLSQTGCYIKSTGYLSAGVGGEVEVRFSVSDVHFRAPAKVRLVRPGKGAGFEFLRIEQNLQKNVGALIERPSCQAPVLPEVPAGLQLTHPIKSVLLNGHRPC
jgi:hypothetical protein